MGKTKGTIGAAIVLDGEKEFKEAVTSCNKSITAMRSEMSLCKEKYADSANSITALQKKHDILAKTLQAYREKQEEVRKGLEHAEGTQRKVEDGLEKLKVSYGQAEKEMNRLRSSGTATDAELKKQEKLISDLSEEIKKGEKNYQTAGNRIQDWKNKLNTAESQILKANRALESNDRYLNEAKKSTNHCATSIDKFGKKVNISKIEIDDWGKGIRENLKTQAVIAGVQQLGSAIKKAGESAVSTARETALYADDINTLATQTGLAADTLQELKYMEDLVDVSLDTVTKSMAKNIRSMRKAEEGSDSYAKVYKKLGVSIIDAQGNLRDSEEVYWDVVDALGDVKNETERNADAMTLFGRSAQDLNPLIAQGSEGINQLKEEAKEMGAVLDQDTMTSLNSANDQFDRLTQQSAILKRELGVSLTPSVLEASTEIGNAIKENKEELKGLATGGIDVVADGLTWIINHAEGVIAAISAMTSAAVGLKVGINAVNFVGKFEKIASYATPIGAVAGVVATLTGVIIAYSVASNRATTQLQKEAKAEEANINALQKKHELLNDNIKQTRQKVVESQAETTTVSNLVDRLKKLNHVQGKTAEQKSEIKRIVEQLKSKIPEVAEAYDEETASVRLTNKELDELERNYKRAALAAAAKDQMTEAAKQALDAETKINEVTQKQLEWKKKVQEAERKERVAFARMREEEQKAAQSGVYGEEYDKAYNAWSPLKKDLDAAKGSLKKYNNQVKQYTQDQKNANKSMDEAQKFIDKYSSKGKENANQKKKEAQEAKKTAKEYENLAHAFENSQRILKEDGQKVSQTTEKQFENLIKTAKKTGVKLPKSLSEGLNNGAETPESAVKKIKKKISKELLTLAKDARESGVEIPKRITDGLENGTINVETAYKRINQQIGKEADDTEKKMDKTGILISKKTKANLTAGGEAAVEAIAAMKTKLRTLMDDAGVNSVDGLLAGVEKKKPAVKRAYANMGNEIDKSFREAMEIHSPSRKFKRSGVHTVEGLIEGIESKKSNLKKSSDELGDILINRMQNKIEMKDLRTNGKGYNLAQVEKYWKGVQKAIKKGTEANSEALKKYYEAHNELINQRKEAMKELKASYKEETKSLRQSLKEVQDEYKEQMKERQQEFQDIMKAAEEKIANTYSVFDKASISKTNNAAGLIKNLKSQVSLIDQWSKNMDTLRKRGLSSDLMAELEEMGVSSAGDVYTLSHMTDQQLKTYQEYYNRRKALAASEARKQNTDEQKSMKAEVASIEAAAKKKMEAQQAAAKKRIEKLSKQYKKQMKSMGVNVSKGFADGIEKGSNDIYKAIAKMTGKTVKQVKKNLGIHSPSRVFDELGGYTGMGFANGLQRETDNLSSILTNALPKSVPAPGTTGAAVAQTTQVARSEPVQLNMYLDSRQIASATFNRLDLMQGANIKLIKRGLAT